MLIEVGSGDVVFPAPEDIIMPTLLDSPAPKLQGYSRESTIEDKLEAMVKLGELKSRMSESASPSLCERFKVTQQTGE